MPAPPSPILTPSSPLWTSPSAYISAEQDALRWRGVMDRLTRLEQQLALTVKYNAQSAPGGSELLAQTLRAAVISGPNGLKVSNVIDDFANLIRTVYDASGVPRVEIGNLPVRGVSPAQFGWRANNPAGSPTVDTFGAISNGVMSNFGVIDVTNQTFTSTAFSTVTGSTINFTVPTPPGRAINILCLFLATGSISSETAGNTGFIRANFDNGTQTSGNLNFGTAGAVTCMGWLFISNASAAAHSVRLDGAVNQTGPTFTMNEAALQVFPAGT